MQALTRISVGRPLAVIAIFLGLAITGFFAYRGLPINLYPKVNFPYVAITTAYPGAGPEEVELQVTRRIEDAVAGLADLDYMTSSSGEGFSVVTLVFTDRANNDLIGTTVERQVNAITQQLPTAAERPTVIKANLDALPVMQLAVVGEGQSQTDLYRIADETVRPQLERIGGVSQIGVIGGQQQEIRVRVDPIKMAAYNVSLSGIQQALAQANTSVPAGNLPDQGRDYNLRVYALVERPEELGFLTVGGPATAPVMLKDVADVTLAAKDVTQITRVNGQPGVLIRLGQQNGANTTDVTDAVTRALPALRASLPPGLDLKVVQDNSVFIRSALDGVQSELVLAVILTAAVLFLFLHQVRVSVIVLLSIPATLLVTFIVMTVLGFSLNILSTLALVLTIGILVDDSIVILENILRRLGRGEPPVEAAINGRAEIGLAALAITLVDVVIFAPVGLVSGQIGSFFREFGFTIAAATLTSLIVSFTLTPMLASRLLKSESERTGGLLGAFGRAWDRGFARLERIYAGLLDWSLSHRPVILVVAAASLIFGLSLIATGAVGVNFFPASDDGTFLVDTTVPAGTTLATHDQIMGQVEERLLAIPEVETVSASVGAASSGGFLASTDATKGSVSVDVGDKGRRKRSVYAIAEDARARLADVPLATIHVNVGDSGGGGSPVAVRLQGPDNAELNRLGGELAEAFKTIPGLRDVTNSAAEARPELRIRVDRARAVQYGISASTLGSAVRLAYSGVVATKYQKPDGSQIDVRVLLRESDRTRSAALADLPIPTAGGETVRLGQIATISQVDTPAQISRRDRRRVVTIGASLEDGVVQSQVDPRVQKVLADLKLPPGYTATVGGTAEQQNQSFGQLGAALGISILLAYLLMAILYNSFLNPLAILFGLPVAAGGAIFSTFLFHYTFNIFSMIGVILLVGLAIKNGILLVDRTNHNRQRGMTRRAALVEAGPARLRAILMTSMTISVALLPSAFQLGEGAELRAPLAATVLGGVISSTLLTLVLVPVVYSLLDGLGNRTGRFFRWLAQPFGRRPARPLPLPALAESASSPPVAREEGADRTLVGVGVEKDSPDPFG
jgi:HAE1 family hydrophobic/amphiphilic exporter-1